MIWSFTRFSLYILWRKGQLIITEPNSWDSDHWKSENSLSHGSGTRVWLFCPWFWGHIRVCPCAVHSPLHQNHWRLVKREASQLPWKSEATSPKESGGAQEPILSMTIPSDSQAYCKLRITKLWFETVHFCGYSNLYSSPKLWFRRKA